ncbi:MAG: hypothetical protein ABEK01_00640 [Candidatus Nanohaloarchaea archaeon]
MITEYAPRLERLRHEAEESMKIDGKNAVDRVQSKLYQHQRWQGIIESNDRGSVDAQEYSMRTNTVREKFRRMGTELDRMKAKYLGQQEFVDYLEGLRNSLPRKLDGGRDRNVEWTEEQLREEFGEDAEEAVELLEGEDDVNDETFDPGPSPMSAGS